MSDQDKKLHRGIQLDVKFAKNIGRIEKSITEINSIVEDLRDLGHPPVMSQIMQVAHLCEDLARVKEKLQALRVKG